MKTVLKTAAFLTMVAFLSGCAPAAPATPENAFTDQDALMASVTWNCSNPPKGAWQDPSVWTEITNSDAEKGHRSWQYNGYGDYESAEWGTIASNAWELYDTPAGIKVVAFGAGAMIMTNEWGCEQELNVGVELKLDSKGELVPLS